MNILSTSRGAKPLPDQWVSDDAIAYAIEHDELSLVFAYMQRMQKTLLYKPFVLWLCATKGLRYSFSGGSIRFEADATAVVKDAPLDFDFYFRTGKGTKNTVKREWRRDQPIDKAGPREPPKPEHKPAKQRRALKPRKKTTKASKGLSVTSISRPRKSAEYYHTIGRQIERAATASRIMDRKSGLPEPSINAEPIPIEQCTPAKSEKPVYTRSVKQQANRHKCTVCGVVGCTNTKHSSSIPKSARPHKPAIRVNHTPAQCNLYIKQMLEEMESAKWFKKSSTQRKKEVKDLLGVVTKYAKLSQTFQAKELVSRAKFKIQQWRDG